MTVHADDCECDTYGCELRRKGLQVAPSATPSRHNRVPFRTQEPPAYNRQIRGEHRGGGTFMPYLNVDGSPVRSKQWETHRRRLTDIRNAQRAQAQGATNGV